MSPHIDSEARSFGRPFEQPTGRFGGGHVPRDEMPPYEYSHHALEANERRETVLSSTERRRGQIAVADTVVIPRLETL